MKCLIGDKKFYLMVLSVAVPIMIQNGITNFVSLLDNVMVGQIGTEQMSGVAIINQLKFVYNICVFGGVSGAGIFTAQYFGCQDHHGVRETFRIKILICSVLLLTGLMVFWLGGETLISLYLHGSDGMGSLEDTMYYAKKYLRIIMIELIPFTMIQVYAGTLRETGETLLPMKAGIAAVIINMLLNYVLIFGKLGIPALGVEGAAIATTVARFAELIIVAGWTHYHKDRNVFIQGVYHSWKVSGDLVKKILITGSPLMVNEALWATGQASLMQCYSVRGLSVVAAFNISSTISNVCNVTFIALGNAVGIIMGQMLGAGKIKEARESNRKLIFFSVSSCSLIGIVLILAAPFFPEIYQTDPEIKKLAATFIRISAAYIPLNAFVNAAYFTLRSGGRTMVTFLFDSVYVWCVNIPLAFLLSRYTGVPVAWIYFICLFIDIIKCIIGFVLIQKGVWLNQIVIDSFEESALTRENLPSEKVSRIEEDRQIDK